MATRSFGETFFDACCEYIIALKLDNNDHPCNGELFLEQHGYADEATFLNIIRKRITFERRTGIESYEPKDLNYWRENDLVLFSGFSLLSIEKDKIDQNDVFKAYTDILVLHPNLENNVLLKRLFPMVYGWAFAQ